MSYVLRVGHRERVSLELGPHATHHHRVTHDALPNEVPEDGGW